MKKAAMWCNDLRKRLCHRATSIPVGISSPLKLYWADGLLKRFSLICRCRSIQNIQLGFRSFSTFFWSGTTCLSGQEAQRSGPPTVEPVCSAGCWSQTRLGCSQSGSRYKSTLDGSLFVIWGSIDAFREVLHEVPEAVHPLLRGLVDSKVLVIPLLLLIKLVVLTFRRRSFLWYRLSRFLTSSRWTVSVVGIRLTGAVSSANLSWSRPRGLSPAGRSSFIKSSPDWLFQNQMMN